MNMDVDGRKHSDTLRHGSDDWNDFPCSPCAKDGKTVAAVKYCVECDENLCSACLTHHNRFAIMRGHKITDKLSSQTGQKRPDLPSQRRDKHGGKLVDLYCSGHDSVGCSACIAVDHSGCQEVKYIPDLTKGNQSRKGISDLETKLQHLSTRLEQLKQQKQDQVKHLQQEKDKLLNEIRVLRKQINDKLDKMEKTLLDDVKTKFEGFIQSTNQCIDTIVNMKASVETSQKNIQEAKQSNQAESFVQLKRGNSSLLTHENTLNILRTQQGVSMKLLPSNDIKSLLTQDEMSLGRISEILVPKSMSHHGDVSVRVQSDRSRCWISDICVTTSGSVVITDANNNRIKKLDDSHAVIEHLDMPDQPHSLCEVDSTHLAVTLFKHKKVQFVSQLPLRLGTSFPVGDVCQGITCLHGQLYVSCGGRTDKGESPGHVEVYDMTGVLLRTFYEGLSWPGFILATGGDELLISDFGKSNMMRVSMPGYLVSEMQIRKLSYPGGLCRIGDDQLCIAGIRSNNIVLTSGDGREQQELLTEKDGIVNPRTVCFDKKQSRLIVSLDDSDLIKVFDVIL